MPVVLNLHPAPGDFQTQRSVELISRIRVDDATVTVRSIGPGGDFTSVPQAIVAMRSSTLPRPDVAHAWGPAELIAAAASGFERIIFSPQRIVSRTWIPWIEFVLRRRRVEIVCPTTALRNAFLARGVSAHKCRVIFPGVDFDRLRGPDDELRADLGLAHTDMVLLVPGESVREACHRQSVWSVGILNFLDERYRLLTWGRGVCADSLTRFAHQRGNLLTQAEKRLGRAVDFEQITGAADAAIVSANALAPMLPVLICMAAGLPVVAVKTMASSEFLEDNITGLLEPSASPRRLAERVLDLRRDAALRSKIVGAARTMVHERFSAAQFISNWRKVYRRLLGSEDSCSSARACAS
jgi:glycosyltransferase involved in cell wall biosynthesis